MWPVSPRIIAILAAAAVASAAIWYVLHLRSSHAELAQKVADLNTTVAVREETITGLKLALSINQEASNGFQKDLEVLRIGARKPPDQRVRCYVDPVPVPGAAGGSHAAAGAGLSGGPGTGGRGAVPGLPGPDIAASLYALADQADVFQANLVRLQERDTKIAGLGED